MDDHDLVRLLGDTAASPTRPVDPPAIAAGISRRRRARRAVVGGVAGSVLLVVGLATSTLVGGDDSRDVQIGGDPVSTSSTSTTESPTRNTLAGVLEGYIPAMPPVGVAIENDGGLLFINLEVDNAEFWAPNTEFADLTEIPGLESVVSARLPRRVGDQLQWFDPYGGGWSVHSEMGAPLAYGGWIAGPTAFLLDGEGQAIVETAAHRWWLSHDLRVVTWTDCESGCSYEMYDSLTDERRSLPEGCWVAAAEADQRVLICDDATTVVIDGERVNMGETVGGEPARVVAAWPNGMVWLDHGTCHAHEALRIANGEVHSLLTEVRRSGPSAIFLGMASDGRALVHLNAAACEAGDPDPGVYLVDLETREREQVWSGAVLPGEVRAWWSAPPRPWVIPEGTTEVGQRDLTGQFVLYGQEGVGVLTDGGVDWWWTEGPVRQARSDGRGGIVFQEWGMSGEGVPMLAVTGAIRWMDSTGESTELIPEGDHAHLHLVTEYEDALSAFVVRNSFPDPDDPSRVTSILHVLELETGKEGSLGIVGERIDSGIDGVAVGSGGLVLSRCHLQCSLWLGLDENEANRMDLPIWRTGLDAESDLIATVEFLNWDHAGPEHDPALTLRNFAGDLVRQVPLPYDPEGSPWSWVDLADDGRSALVVTPLLIVQAPDRYQVVLVTGLDTPLPQVQIVRTDHALRFG